MRRFFCLALAFLTASFSISQEVLARAAYDAATHQPGPNATTSPAYCIAEHNVGRMALAITNHGTFGDGFAQGGSTDCITGDRVESCEYPKESRTKYLFAAAIWIGAVVGRDTLVSVGADGWSFIREFSPDIAPMGDLIYRSNIDPARPEYEDAVSEQDFIAVYSDVCLDCVGVGNDAVDNRPHVPLNVEITERSYAWSYSYAQDFVLFDYAIKNIGNERLTRVYMGIYVDADIYSLVEGNAGAQDDLCGFREKQPALYLKPPCPPDSDIVNVAWTVDNDGDLNRVGVLPVPGVTATRIVRTPSDSLSVSFNWWVSNVNAALDFGPQRRGHVRDFGTGGLGTPEGDRNKFYILSNGEFDYDQPRVATIGNLDSVWLPPPPDRAGTWATGLDTRYVLSFGQFAIEPGQTLPISLAYVAGPRFHQHDDNFANLPDNPDGWYEGVNFDSLGTNSTWADWVYDNPGVDTDSDGYSGEYTLCNIGDDSTLECDTSWDIGADPDTMIIECTYIYDKVDTVWRKGDGVPDFRGASPPPSPATYSYNGHRGMRIEASTANVKIRWNGVLSENTPDVFSREYDFEGYRVWLARDERASSYSLAASYDRQDYNRFEWNIDLNTWQLLESPFIIEDLRSMYGDSSGDTTWDPLNYTRNFPLIIPGEPGQDPDIYYFEPQDYNRSILGNDQLKAQTPIRKTFPEAPKPEILDPDSIMFYYPNDYDRYLTEEGFVKYYEYEYTFENLLPTVPYWLNITAFDYGSPRSGLEALETNPTILPINTFALPTTDHVKENGLDVFVYPNPYRADGDYRARGFEARGEADRDNNRVMRLNFANLPVACWIRIYSIDGDLVREWRHELDEGDPLATHDTWDLITRNSQLIVSGLYYWIVEDDLGNVQMGKVAVIL